MQSPRRKVLTRPGINLRKFLLLTKGVNHCITVLPLHPSIHISGNNLMSVFYSNILVNILSVSLAKTASGCEIDSTTPAYQLFYIVLIIFKFQLCSHSPGYHCNRTVVPGQSGSFTNSETRLAVLTITHILTILC